MIEEDKEAVSKMSNTLRATLGYTYQQCGRIKDGASYLCEPFNGITTCLKSLVEQGELEQDELEALQTLMTAVYDGSYALLAALRGHTNAILIRHGITPAAEDADEQDSTDEFPDFINEREN